jgi:hypothetical protein
MPPDRQAALDALGFAWESAEKKPRDDSNLIAKWNLRYAELVAFQREHGHTRVPKGPPGNKVLWHWRHVQREFRRKGMLRAERIARLDALGFEWEEPDCHGRSREEKWETLWEAMFQQLVQFRERFGHGRVVGSWEKNPHLRKWAQRQRYARRCGVLRLDRQARLDALGFDWQIGRGGSNHDVWEQRYAELAAFQREHGHTRVGKGPPGNKVLWHWRHVQREFRRKGILKPERIARLDSLGFEWEEPPGKSPSMADFHARIWNAKFELLRQFHERFGHTRVPNRWKEPPGLGPWAQMQRRAIRRQTISAERLARLESLGFPSTVHPDPATRTSASYDQMWRARLDTLRQFHERFGHARVPRSWQEDPGLGEWVRAQRRAHRQNQLKPERQAQLDRLGFEWDASAAADSAAIHPGARDQRLRDLAAFQARFGHTRVPVQWKENPGLGAWASMQRHLRRKGRLSARRIALLVALGFDWGRP